MAKPPVDTFEKMLAFIETQLRSKKFVANYQPVMIKFLLQNGDQNKRQIAQELWLQNNKEREQSHYLNVPVFRVLVNNGVVTKKGNLFSLVLQNLEEGQKEYLFKILDSSISRQMSFAEKGYLPFEEAKEKVRELAKQYDLKNSSDWTEFVKSGKKPDDIPSNPSSYYKKKKTSKDDG
jgi:hypothetical protein